MSAPAKHRIPHHRADRGLRVDAEHAQIIVKRPEPDVVGLPAGWGETLTGEPMPNVVAAVRRVRDEH